MMIYSVIAISHSIFGLTKAWLLVASKNIPCCCDLHGFRVRLGMALGMEAVFSLDTCLL
jgi:hypothetical protein